MIIETARLILRPLLKEPGIFAGWNMNKAHWLSVALDGCVEDEKINFLVDMSYELTNGR